MDQPISWHDSLIREREGGRERRKTKAREESLVSESEGLVWLSCRPLLSSAVLLSNQSDSWATDQRMAAWRRSRSVPSAVALPPSQHPSGFASGENTRITPPNTSSLPILSRHACLCFTIKPLTASYVSSASQALCYVSSSSQALWEQQSSLLAMLAHPVRFCASRNPPC